jgi:hypothetical protein
MAEPEGRADIAARELAVAERRIALEESFPRKWGGAIFSAAATVCVAIVTAGVTYIDGARSRDAAARADQVRAEQHRIENARLALTIYFDNIQLMRGTDDASLRHLDLVSALTEHETVQDLLRDMQAERMAAQLSPEVSVAEAAATLPALHTPRDRGLAGQSVYIHRPAGSRTCEDDASQLALAFARAGAQVPPEQVMEPGRSPEDHSLRFYTKGQAEAVGEAARALLDGVLDGDVEEQVLPQTLPGTIFEVWLGERACA